MNPARPKLGRRDFLSQAAAAGVAAGLYSLSKIPRVEAHYDDVRIEIYEAVTIPTITGAWDSNFQTIGENTQANKWNDAYWTSIPIMYGNVTAYSGYKHDGQFIYMAHDVLSIKNLPSDNSGAFTMFDPENDGGTQFTNLGDFEVYPIWYQGKFWVSIRYGQSNGQLGDIGYIPSGLAGGSKICSTPFLDTPHLFYEVKLPLSVGGLDKHLDSTIGMEQEIHNSGVGDNEYPPIKDYTEDIPNNYVEAFFSKRTNPSLTTPPTVVPEFPWPELLLGASVIATTAAIYVSRKRVGVKPYTEGARQSVGGRTRGTEEVLAIP
jgi:hypothetical protein